MKQLIAGLIVFLVMVGCSYGTANLNYTEHSGTLTRDAERICSGGQDGSCKYLVYTTAGEFENTDSFWHLKFNSSTLHSQMTEGKQCEWSSVWYRIGWLSAYPNILEITCVDPDLGEAQ